MNFQDLIGKLHEFWKDQDCILEYPHDVEVGAGTFNPATFFGCLGSGPWRVAYVEPSRRPQDGRYGDNPLRMRHYYQYQVILKPTPDHIQDLYLDSLRDLEIDLRIHDLRFVKDDWQSPTLGAWGLGWEVWLDGMEITQFTYFQQMGGIDLDPISVELTYGLERIAMFIQDVDHFADLKWNDVTTYGELKLEPEREFCKYNFEKADIDRILKLYELNEQEAKHNLEENLIFPAYDYALKCSHLFNILDARKALSITERERYIQRIQDLAKGCAREYLKRLGSGKVAEKVQG